MRKRNIIKMILTQFGYNNIEIETFWTGTGDGAYPNRLGYEISGEKADRVIDASGNDFHEAIQDLFENIAIGGINEMDVKYIDESIFSTFN